MKVKVRSEISNSNDFSNQTYLRNQVVHYQT